MERSSYDDEVESELDDVKSQFVEDAGYERLEYLDQLRELIGERRGRGGDGSGAKTPPLKYADDPYLQADHSESSYTSRRSFNKSNKSVK